MNGNQRAQGGDAKQEQRPIKQSLPHAADQVGTGTALSSFFLEQAKQAWQRKLREWTGKRMGKLHDVGGNFQAAAFPARTSSQATSCTAPL